MNLNKDPSKWAKVRPAEVMAGSAAQARNVLVMALEDIQRLARELESERDAREKLDRCLREKDTAMRVLFDRLKKAGVDCSDLIP